MAPRRRIRIAISAGLCALVVICALWGIFLAGRRRAAERQAEAEWRAQFAQDMEDPEAHYLENQETYQRIFAAFQKDAALIRITADDPGESNLREGWRYWRDFQEDDPALYQAFLALQRSGAPWQAFSRDYSENEPYPPTGLIECELPVARYRPVYWTHISLFSGESAPEEPSGAVYWKELDAHCWLVVEEHGMPE